MLPHNPIKDKLNLATHAIYTREIWGPSFGFAKVASELIFEKFEIALRDKALATKIQPYGFNSTLSTVTQVVSLSNYLYDVRMDKDFETEDFEPPSNNFDNHMPKNAKVKAPLEAGLNALKKENPHLVTIKEDDQVSIAKSTNLRKKTANSGTKPAPITQKVSQVEIEEVRKDPPPHD